jgi:hypothetical protein
VLLICPFVEVLKRGRMPAMDAGLTLSVLASWNTSIAF